MSMMALALAAIAIVLAIVLRATAPTSSGTVMSQASVGGPYDIAGTCTHYPNAQVTIVVPGPGTVVVSATVGVGINHTFGVNDIAQIVLAGSNTECTVNNFTAFVSVPASLPTDPFHYQTVSLLRPFPVAGAGSHTFFVNGMMSSGASQRDRFDSASLVAVFHA
jgi:hypothetical protein